jgi:hypothetical protein
MTHPASRREKLEVGKAAFTEGRTPGDPMRKESRSLGGFHAGRSPALLNGSELGKG